MIVRYDATNVYIEASDGELDYFMHEVGLDDSDVEDLSQTDINKLAETICSVVFMQLGDETPLVEHLSEEWDGEELAVELLRIDGGVQLKVCPLSKYHGPDPRYFDTKSMKRHSAKSHKVDFGKDFLPTNENMKEFLNEELTDEFIDSTITNYLTMIYKSVPTMPIELAMANLLKSELCYAYIAKGLEDEIESTTEKFDMADTTRQLLLEFMERVKKIYKDMRIEIFYKVRCLNDALKAMIYVSDGCIIKIKDTYYVVTTKDNLIFSDFGNKVDNFCYADDSIICKIKDGYFASTNNEEKEEC